MNRLLHGLLPPLSGFEHRLAFMTDEEVVHVIRVLFLLRPKFARASPFFSSISIL
jgi:hypothetical protein